MLVFRMDTTGLFRYGQRHELRILFPPKETAKNRFSVAPKLSNGVARKGVGRSNSHYISRSNPALRFPRDEDVVDHRSPAHNLSTDVILANVRREYSDRKGSITPSVEFALSNASYPEVYDSHGRSAPMGCPVPPVRRRRKSSSSSSLKTRKRYVEQGSVTVDDAVQGLVLIRIKPDDSGKYGFNVKGGSDQNQPVLVSKVAPGTPADQCYPRLNEGDQVMFINGLDVSAMTHMEVVKTIQNSQNAIEHGLALKVKQNVYEAEGIDEPSFQYVPETIPEILSSRVIESQGGALDESMLLLSEALDSGALVAQFEQLYRRKPGMSMNDARRLENEKKNRYRDISPYDGTRVLLKSTPSGDYINASHVNMEIPRTGILNRYIAAQGPLSGTCADFWSMVWDQGSNLIVMLTSAIEQGRIKCHRYWPKVNETSEYGSWKVTCTSEEETPGFAFRDCTILNTQTNEERAVSHMQYLAWPDHGVPDDPTDFLKFVAKVRKSRMGMSEPTIVHCSAGIGRTGVLILMETAQCLIEANEPVYPLDIVKEMRNQRAMMIQTASQYRFVCEAIQRVYNEGLIQPLPEYQLR